ncbi:MAG: hypothetical protein HOP07_02810 [Bacteriovoracaceae bacterium]|nr:hypothetical protein [Bacteriovoracaceae bacterium]
MQLEKLVPKALALFMLSTLVNFSWGAEKLLCLVTNDVDKEIGKMVYELDEDGRKIKHLFKESYSNGTLVSRVELQVKDLLGAGIILNKVDKFVTVRMYSHNFDEESGGVIYLDTLYNGINGDRKEYVIEVSHDGVEAKMTANKADFSRMHFVAKRSKILGIIGIEKVNFLK